MFCARLAAMLRLLLGPIVVRGVGLDINTLLYAAAATVIGWQSIIFLIYASIHGIAKASFPPIPRSSAPCRG